MTEIAVLDAHGRFYCSCSGMHWRGPVNGHNAYRCLACGRTWTAESCPEEKEKSEMHSYAIVFLACLLPFTAGAHEETLRVSRIVAVYDGDTVTIDIDGLPAVFGQALGIRLRGIDTPELRTRDTCEKAMAARAREVLRHFVEQGDVLLLTALARDKYFRVSADLLVDGKSASAYMLASGYARPYVGETRQPWTCPKEERIP